MAYVVGLERLGRRDVAVAGGKGANLGELMTAGVRVPAGFVVTTAAYARFEADGAMPADVATEVSSAYRGLTDHLVAVRSSATAEDLAEASSAGQQESFLGVRSEEDLLARIEECWRSLRGERAVDYRRRQGVDEDTVAMAVVVQELVAARSAGVLFTAHPGTGRRDQVVIAAAWGLGESVVGGTVDAEQLVVQADGSVVERRPGRQQAQIVPVDGGTGAQPLPDEQQGRAVLDDAAAAEMSELGRRIAGHFGVPQDIEWARDADGAFWIVPVPSDHRAAAARGPAADQLARRRPDRPLRPGQHRGAAARSADPAVRGTDRRRRTPLPDHPLRRARSRGDRPARRRQPADDQRLRLLPLQPARDDPGHPAQWSCLSDAADRADGDPVARRRPPALPRDRTRLGRPRYRLAVRRGPARRRRRTAPRRGQLLHGRADGDPRGGDQRGGVLPLLRAAGPSPRDQRPPPATFLLGLDSEPIRAETSLWDLAQWAGARQDLVTGLNELSTIEIGKRAEAETDAGNEPWAEFGRRLREHLDRFGHAVYTLDFATPVPTDEPGPLLDAVRYYLSDAGGTSDPRVRQARAAERRDAETAATASRLDPVRRRVFLRLLRWAQRSAPVREDALADVGLAWPQLRQMLLLLGDRLVAAGVVERREDVFWLRTNEIEQRPAGLPLQIEARRARWRGQRRVTPPQLLPEHGPYAWMRWWLPATSDTPTGDVLTGIAASGGVVTGPARVLIGPQDFGTMEPGDILVASITTPAWTPLFARAAAVVTDIGGPLSHSSIVAREYGVPAVLGTGVATRRITTGQRVRVDGDAGTVTLLDEARSGWSE